MALAKKHYLIAAGIGVTLMSITAGVLYIQYKKLMNYAIKFGGLKIKTLTENLISFDIFLLLTVYINNKLTAKIGNDKKVTIQKGVNTIPLAIAFNPKKSLGDVGGVKGVLAFMLNPEKTKIRVDIKLYVKFYFIKTSIPFTYQTTIKELLNPQK